MADFYKQGERGTTDVTTLMSFWVEVTSSAQYHTIRSCNEGGVYPPVTTTGHGYQVTAGKTLYLTRLAFQCSGSSTNAMTIGILYGDTDVGWASAAAPTTPIQRLGNAVSTTRGPKTNQGLVNAAFDMGIFVKIPAAKYPCIQTTGDTGWVYFEGFEA